MRLVRFNGERYVLFSDVIANSRPSSDGRCSCTTSNNRSLLFPAAARRSGADEPQFRPSAPVAAQRPSPGLAVSHGAARCENIVSEPPSGITSRRSRRVLIGPTSRDRNGDRAHAARPAACAVTADAAADAWPIRNAVSEAPLRRPRSTAARACRGNVAGSACRHSAAAAGDHWRARGGGVGGRESRSRPGRVAARRRPVRGSFRR